MLWILGTALAVLIFVVLLPTMLYVAAWTVGLVTVVILAGVAVTALVLANDELRVIIFGIVAFVASAHLLRDGSNLPRRLGEDAPSGTITRYHSGDLLKQNFWIDRGVGLASAIGGVRLADRFLKAIAWWRSLEPSGLSRRAQQDQREVGKEISPDTTPGSRPPA